MARRDTILVSRTLYQVGVVTLVASIFWVLIGIYLAATKPLEIDVDATLLDPIDTNIDQKTLTALSKRLKIEEIMTEATESASEINIITIEENVGVQNEPIN